MYGDLKSYFYKKIVPEYKDYIDFRENNIFKNNNDARIGLICANGMYHFREHLPVSLKQSRAYFTNKCPDYNLLGDIANVSKHKRIDNNNPQISDLSNIQELLVITTYKDKFGEFNKVVKEVEVKLDNGDLKLLSSILTNSINMWIDYLFENKIITHGLHFDISNKIPKRPTNKNFDMGAIQGLTFSGFKIKLQKYNYEKNIIEPIDLTNANIKFSVYLPEDSNYYDIKLKLPNSKQIIEFAVILKDSIVKELEVLDDKERIEQLIIIAKEQGTI